MSMQSLALLPKLRELPTVEGVDTLGPDHTMAMMRDIDRNHFAIEVSQATEETLETLFHARNVPDELNEAYRLAFSSVADDSSLHEQYREMLERGSGSVTGFVSNLKGKVAELKAEAALEERNPGYDSLVTRAFRVGSAAWGRLGEGFGLFRSGVVLWPMRSLWCAIPRQGRHQRARNGSCSLMQRWERWPGQPVGPTSRPTVPGPFA